MAVDRFPIEYGHVMTFARAIGDPNPIYHDEEYAASTELGGIIAPPTFVQASAQFNPEYGLRPHPDRPWHGSGKEPTTRPRPRASSADTSGAQAASGDERPRRGGGGGLHAEQHYTYHRPLRVGDVLSARTSRGESWEKEGRRGGKLVFSETITEYLDDDGELVITARLVGVRTERPVES
jgi:acyl dehydratase